MRGADAYRVWLAFNAVQAFGGTLVWTVVAVYYVTVVGMSPFELVLVGTVMEVAVFTFEVPTGVVADTYSRRLSIIVAFLVCGAAYLAIAATQDVAWILAANFLLGIGLTFESGARQAWITDELEGRELERVFLAGTRIGYAGSLLGIGAAVALGLVDLRLAILAGGVVYVALAAALALVMPERQFEAMRHDDVRAWRGIARNARAGFGAVRHSWILLVILVVTLFFAASSEALDRLTEAHFIRSIGLPEGLEPIVWFGMINAVGLVLGFALATLVLRRLRPTRAVRTVESLLAIDAVLIVALLVFAFATSFWLGLVAYLVARQARGLRMPFFNAWLNQNTESRTRATVNSVVGQGDALGEVAMGPALGALGSFTSIRVALATSAGLLLPALALYGHAIRRGGRERLEPEVERA